MTASEALDEFRASAPVRRLQHGDAYVTLALLFSSTDKLMLEGAADKIARAGHAMSAERRDGWAAAIATFVTGSDTLQVV